MKKSEIYKHAQLAVMRECNHLDAPMKVEILRELFNQEDLAKFSEEQEAKQG